MTGAVLALCDGSSPSTSRAAAGLALQLAAEPGLPIDVAFVGATRWEDRGWQRAWRIDAGDGRGAAGALKSIIEGNACSAIVAGDSPLCREALGRLSGSLGLPLAGRVLSATVTDGALELVRAVDEGRRSAKYRLAMLPALVLVDPSVSFPAPVRSAAYVDGETVCSNVPAALHAVGERSLGPLEIAPQEAEVVVAGGRGVGEDGFRLVDELAGLLHGAVGASRVAVDLGWAPRTCQVGMTGQVVQARLYIAAGISGAVHHTFGMKDSDFIVAINRDAGAPIFQFADAAVVGDAREVLAALIEALKARSGEASARPPVLQGALA